MWKRVVDFLHGFCRKEKKGQRKAGREGRVGVGSRRGREVKRGGEERKEKGKKNRKKVNF